jgi:hypothetical protein
MLELNFRFSGADPDLSMHKACNRQSRKGLSFLISIGGQFAKRKENQPL